MSNSERNETAEKLLDVAEKLFGERGVALATLRDITGEAGANIAAVSYHFGSKEELLRAVFRRRMEPLNAERLRLLDAAEAEAGDEGPTLEAILRCFAGPTVRMSRKHPEFMHFVSRVHTDPDDNRWEFFIRDAHFPELFGRLRVALLRALPGAPHGDLWWGMIFVLGALIQTWAMWDKAAMFSQGEATFDSEEQFLDRIVTFSASGLRALGTPADGGGS
jgi:AcrR family transcriptional regulator